MQRASGTNGSFKIFMQVKGHSSCGLALGPEECYEPCGSNASIQLFFDIAAEDEAEFKHGPELALIRSLRAKVISVRGVDCMHPREIAAKVHSSFLVGWRRGESGACAARPKTQQVDRPIGWSPRTRKIFPAHRKREAALECVADTQRTASCGCGLGDAYLQVGRQFAELEVRLNDPWALGVRIDHRVHITVVLHRRSCRLIGGLPGIPHPVVRQTMGSLCEG